MSTNYMHLIHLVDSSTLETVGDTKTIINSLELYNKENDKPHLMVESLSCSKYKDEDTFYSYSFTLPTKTIPLRPVKLRARDTRRQTVNLANSVWDSPYNIPLEDF